MPPKGWSKKEGRVTSPTTGKRKRQMRKYWRKLQKKKDPLTEREKQVLYYVRSFQAEELYSPTAVDLAATFYITPSIAARYIKSLIAKGFLESNKERKNGRYIKFPRGIKFPWEDEKQFPRTVFLPPKDLEVV